MHKRELGGRPRSRFLVYGAVLIVATGLGIRFAFGAGSAGPAVSAVMALGGLGGLLTLEDRWRAEGRLSRLFDDGRIEFAATLDYRSLSEPSRSRAFALLRPRQRVYMRELDLYMRGLPVDLAVRDGSVFVTSRSIGSRRAGSFSMRFELSDVTLLSTHSEWHAGTGPGLAFDLSDGQQIRMTVPLGPQQLEFVEAELRRRMEGQRRS